MLGATAASLAANSTLLPEGDAGTRRTIDLERELIDQGLKDPVIRRTATDLLRQVPPFGDLGEVRTVYNFVRSLRYVRDMAAGWSRRYGWTGKETLHTARAVLEAGGGDCDDLNGILLPSLLGSIGYSTRAVIIKADPFDPDTFSHIYLEVEAPEGSGQWIPLDAARPGAQFGLAPEWAWTEPERYMLTGGPREGTSGARRFLAGLGAPMIMPRAAAVVVKNRRRFGRRFGLGQDPSDLQTILQSAPAIEQGAASIVTAANLPSYPVYPGTIYPGMAAPAAGSAGFTLVGSSSASSLVWVLLLVGLGALIVRRRP